MIYTEEAAMWRPRRHTFKVKVELIDQNGAVFEDITKRSESMFSWPDTSIGIGAWETIVKNADGLKSGKWSTGWSIRFSGDLSTGTTKQYEGRIDSISEDSSSEGGNRLRLKGRHIAFQLLETPITLQNEEVDAQTAYINLVNSLPTGHGFSTTNIEVIGSNVSVAWPTKNAADCLYDLHAKANASGYIDADKNIYFFKANSKVRHNDGAIYGNTLIGIPEFGKDTYVNRDKVIVIGQTSLGSEIRAVSGSGNRVKVIYNQQIRTYEEAKSLADTHYNVLQTETPQGIVRCRGLPFVRPGENMWIIAPKNGIYGLFKVLELRHKVKGLSWNTDVVFEFEPPTLDEFLRNSIKNQESFTKVLSTSGFNKSINLVFDDLSDVESSSNVTIIGGYLQLATTAVSTGNVVILTRTETEDVDRAELKLVGTDLRSSSVQFSTDNGENYTTLVDNAITTVPAGKYIKVKINLVTDGDNPNPKVDECNIYYD